MTIAIARENVDSAKSANLRYIHDHSTGIHRHRRGNSFHYTDANDKPLRDPETLARIRALVLPPAWQNVWICPYPNGHLQALGTDQRGRTQYRYHPRWRQVRDETKYEHMTDFAQALPKIRRRVRKDLRQPGLPREKILATVIKLLETTLIRIGNEEYAKTNHSFGLTTMHEKHVAIHGSTIHFEFRGKSGVEHAIDLHNKKLAKIILSCQHLPGHELFQYVDDSGARHAIDSADVNAYLQATAGKEFTAKDFRTWAGTVLATMALQQFATFTSPTQAKKNIVAAIDTVAKKLGNTKAVCRRCYIHPAILETYLDGTLLTLLKPRVEPKPKSSLRALHPQEAAVLTLLQQRLSSSPKAKNS